MVAEQWAFDKVSPPISPNFYTTDERGQRPKVSKTTHSLFLL